MGTFRLLLLILIWRALEVSSEYCSPDVLKYFKNPLPLYKIQRPIGIIVYDCSIQHINVTTKEMKNFTTEYHPMAKIVEDCLRKYEAGYSKKNDCKFPKFVQFENKADNVFYLCENTGQVANFTLNKVITEADIESNEIKIFDHTCEFSHGYCSKANRDRQMRFYIWEVPQDNPEYDICKDKSIYPLGYEWIGNLLKSQDVVVAETANKNNTFCLKRVFNTKIRCNIWRTNIKGIILLNSDEYGFERVERTVKNLSLLESLPSIVKHTSDSKQAEPQSTSILVKYISNSEDLSETQNIMDKISLLHLLILWYIAGTLINIVVNYSTLRKVCQKRKNSSRKYLLYCVTQSLTNRYIYLNQQESNGFEVPTSSTTNNISKPISNNFGNEEYGVDGYLKPKEENDLSTEHSINKEYHYPSVCRVPKNEVYSYAYMHTNRFKNNL